MHFFGTVKMEFNSSCLILDEHIPIIIFTQLAKQSTLDLKECLPCKFLELHNL